MFNNSFFINNKAITLFILLLCSCVSKIQEPSKSDISIKNFVADYNQLDSTYFFQVEISPDYENIESVWVSLSNEDKTIDTTFFLNDSAHSGDQIMMNNTYSGIFYIPLPFMDYQLNAVIQTQSGLQFSNEKNILIQEQFYPQLVDIIFQKKYVDGSGYEFRNNTPYFVNKEDTSYLNFQIKIKDLNGKENIQSIRYETVTLWNYAIGDCGCPEGQTCSFSSPTFYMTYLTSSDSTVTYEAINNYIKEPGFLINPTSVCDRFGVITFSFIVFDSYFGPQTFVEELLFSPCNEGAWNCEEDCEYCLSVCGECNE